MNKIIGLLIIILIIATGCTTDQTTYTIGDSVSYNEMSFVVKDAYYGDYNAIDPSTLTFDKYLCFDLQITNLASEEQTIKTYSSFKAYDSTDQARHVMMDENKKEFSKTLQTNEQFDITLVFPVEESSSYQLVYQTSRRSKHAQDIVWEVSATDLATKTVEPTVEHNDVKAKADEKKSKLSKGGNSEE